MAPTDSNPILDAALNYRYPPYCDQTGTEKVVAFGDHSHKCPIYVTRVPPCTAACPAGEDIRGFHNLLRGVEKSGDAWTAAWERIVAKNPFPAVMGRVCPHPCQSKCNRGDHDERVAINAVEQAIGDHGIRLNLPLPAPGPATGHRVAVVGGGPAGLSAAYQLRRMGHAVTLFESADQLGGMVRYGVMGYRVDRKILDAEIRRIMDLGVEARMGVRVGPGGISLDQLEREFDAVFIGVGAQNGRQLPVPGFTERPETTNAIDFLRDFELGALSSIAGSKVLVVGDGSVAIDVARLALRLGADAEVVSAVPREEMSCLPEELQEGLDEGARIRFNTGVLAVAEESGVVHGLRCIRMEAKKKGEEGWDSPVPFDRFKEIPGTEFELRGGMIVASIGQTTEMAGLESLTENSARLKLDRDFRVSGREKVFGGGDAFRIDLIVTAIGHGRRAAESIDRFLRGLPLSPDPFREEVDVRKQDISYFLASPPQTRIHRTPEEIVGDFEELIEPLSREEAVEESNRCMSCGLCFNCSRCLNYCPQEAISDFPDRPLGEVMYTDYSRCVGCHICSLICPSGYIQMGMGEGL